MENKKRIIVAVDGPAGSGKSSICAAVASSLGWFYINTGALYRALALLLTRSNISLTDESALKDLIGDFEKELHWEPKLKTLFYKEENLTPLLGTVEVGNAASKIAKIPKIRELLLPLQRQLAMNASTTGALLDGRDIGTVVFPNADLKIFMTAGIEERAKRRLMQLSQSNSQKTLPTLDELISDIKLRDRQDSERGVAPLAQAQDAIVFDTSHLSMQECEDAMLLLIQKRCGQA